MSAALFAVLYYYYFGSGSGLGDSTPGGSDWSLNGDWATNGDWIDVS